MGRHKRSVDDTEGPCRLCPSLSTQCKSGCSRPTAERPGGKHSGDCPCKPVLQGMKLIGAHGGFERCRKVQDIAPQAAAMGADATEGGVTAKHWHKPVAVQELRQAFEEMWGMPAPEAVVQASRSYLVLRRLMELHRRSTLHAELFSLDHCRVQGAFLAEDAFKTMVGKVNTAKSYTIETHEISLNVSMLNSCRMLSLHSVDSRDDFVQQQVRKNILAAEGGTGARGVAATPFLRTALRAILVVHSTRHYEYSRCVRGQHLHTREHVVSCFAEGAPNRDMSLVRRLTSEGIFFCGKASEPYMLIACSNVMDTFEGGQYHGEFEEMVHALSAVLYSRDEKTEDAEILHYCWNRVKNWRGFGGGHNDEDGDVKGFVAKNIVFQGLRNWLCEIGVRTGYVDVFVSGPNPVKLGAIFAGCQHPSRHQHLSMYKCILEDVEDCDLVYGSETGSLASTDLVLLQDSLCKAVEVFQTTTTGRFFGKARAAALRTYGTMKANASG